MRVRTVSHYLDARLFEWAFSVPMIMLGIAILVWPVIAHGSILRLLVTVIGAVGAALVFITIGIVGMVALIANGSSLRIGPRLRALSAIIRSILWISFALSMARVSFEQGFPSPMVFFWSSFTGAEIYISYRAALDVRSIVDI
jgi:hypothetical protein